MVNKHSKKKHDLKGAECLVIYILLLEINRRQLVKILVIPKANYTDLSSVAVGSCVIQHLSDPEGL